MNNLSHTVQNGKTMKHESDGSISDIEEGLGQIRVFETENNIVITHHVTARERLYNEYSKFAVKTAQSTIEMCRIVFEAKTTLAKSEYDYFLKDVGRKSEDSTVRKFLAIGERYDDLIAATALLPASWTSIYEITQIPSDVFMAMVAMGESMAHLTGAQLKQLSGKKTYCKSQSSTASAAAPTTAAPQTAQNSTEACEDINAASDETPASASAVTHSDAKQTDSVQSDAADSATAFIDATSDESSIDSDRQFAHQATSTMLERVAAAASTHVEIEADDTFEAYDVTIRFNSKPSDVAVAALVESLASIKSKYRLDFEIVDQNDLVD